MRLRPLQHLVVRRRLVFKVVRLHIIAPHGMILESLPHQNPPQIGMARKHHSEKVEDLPLLKLRRAPDGRERRQLDGVAPVPGAHPQDHRPMFCGHRVEVVNGFEIAGLDAFARLLDRLLNLLLHSVHGLCNFARYFNFLGDLFVRPVHSGYVRQKIEGQLPVVAQEPGYGNSGLRREPQRVLCAGAAVGHNLHHRARHGRFNRRLDLFHRLQSLTPDP